MPRRLAIALAGIVFLVTLLVRLPASWVAALLPKGMSCADPGGTLWQGSCGQLQSKDFVVADLRWTLHAWSLLSGRPAVDIRSEDARARGSASLRLGKQGDADITALSASLPLQAGLLPIPAGWSGQLQLDIAHAAIASGQLTSIEGTVRILQLHWENPATDFGGFELSFPAADTSGPVRGNLRDLGGPLAAQGTLELKGNAYEVDALLSVRPGADTGMEQLLQMAGPPDAQGRHSLSVAGTY